MSAERTVWDCESCGKLTDGRSGIDDAMDCFCARCSRCGGLTELSMGGDQCLCGDFDGEVRTCKGCGCTDDYGCDGGCWWVAEDLCSECQPTREETPTP